MSVGPLHFSYNENSQRVDAPILSEHVDSIVLVAGVAQDYTTPANTEFVFMNSTADFYMKAGTGAASIPVASTSDGSASELSPDMRSIKGNQVLSFISPTACIITVACYH